MLESGLSEIASWGPWLGLGGHPAIGNHQLGNVALILVFIAIFRVATESL